MKSERLSKLMATMLSISLIGFNWLSYSVANITKDQVISTKDMDNLNYSIIKRNGNTMVKLQTFKLEKVQQKVQNDSNASNGSKDPTKNAKDQNNTIKKEVDDREISVPNGYYVMKYNYCDLDNDGNKEITVVLKNQWGDYGVRIYCYRVINNSLVFLPLNNKGRRITYPYYKEDVEFYNNCIAIYYINKYFDISKAKFQLVYREKYSIGKKEATLCDQDNYVINSPSNRDMPNFKQSKPTYYSFSNRSRTDEIKMYDTDFKSVAKKYKIPTAILKAVAISESNITQSIDGIPLVSFDGGIGIMQITPQSYISDINSIAYSPIYNIEKGAQELCEKWNYKYKNIIPKTSNDNRNILENWYFALWAYNGWHKMNNPNMVPYHTSYGIRNYAYQEKVLGTVEQLTGNDVTLFDAKKLFPKNGLPDSSKVFDTPAPYHYGDIGVSVTDKDTHPDISNVTYNANDNSINWNFVDKDYGDYQKGFGIKIVYEGGNSTPAASKSNVSNKIAITGKTAITNGNFYKINPKLVQAYFYGNNCKSKFVINNKLNCGIYSAYIIVQDKYNLQSDLYKVPLKVTQ